MHNSNAISILNRAFDSPGFFTYGVRKLLFKSLFSKLPFIGRISKHVSFFKLLFLSSAPSQTRGFYLEISVARRKCLCVSGKVFLWSTHFDIRILVPMSQAGGGAAAATAAAAAVCCSMVYIYIYIYVYIYIETYILYNC